MGRKSTTVIIAALVAALAAAPAFAQEAKDTLRIGFLDPISTVDLYFDPKPETGLTSRSVFETLIHYDPADGEFKPVLAESWKRVDDKTLEFKLRRDVKFHDGSPFDADDVVYTINFLIDPKVNLRFKSNFTWIDKAEKIDQHTVRITAKRPTAYDLARMAVSVAILPSDVHSKFDVKSDFGRKTPIGTGPYKVEHVDPTKGVTLVKNEDYRHSNPWNRAASIGRIHAMPIPDLQTQIAQMMTGGLDLIHEVPKDQAEQLVTNPDFAMTALQGLVFYYMSMDSVNRSGNEALSDQRVRKALSMAIDRGSLARNVITGGSVVTPIDAICIKTQVACEFSTAPPAFDREGARKLLADAGYPNGFDIEITSIPGAQKVAEAIAGELRKIDVRAKVDHRTFGSYRKKQREGKLQVLVSHYSSGGLPDASALLAFFFGGGARDYWRDETLAELRKKGESTIDPERRRDIYRQAFDRVNEMNYIMPITTSPAVFVHTREVRIAPGSLNPGGADLFRISWN